MGQSPSNTRDTKQVNKRHERDTDCDTTGGYKRTKFTAREEKTGRSEEGREFDEGEIQIEGTERGSGVVSILTPANIEGIIRKTDYLQHQREEQWRKQYECAFEHTPQTSEFRRR